MCLLRHIVLLCVKANVHITARYIPGRENVLADYVSRISHDMLLLYMYLYLLCIYINSLQRIQGISELLHVQPMLLKKPTLHAYFDPHKNVNYSHTQSQIVTKFVVLLVNIHAYISSTTAITENAYTQI